MKKNFSKVAVGKFLRIWTESLEDIRYKISKS